MAALLGLIDGSHEKLKQGQLCTKHLLFTKQRTELTQEKNIE